MRLIEMILTPYQNRLLRAYRKRHPLDLDEFVNLSKEAREKLFLNAEREFNVPKTESHYVYHGTSRDRLEQIKEQGLVPSIKSRYRAIDAMVNSLGNIFFSSDLDIAEIYSSRAGNGIILRVALVNIPQYEVDPLEDNSIYTSQTIPPANIQYWNNGWKDLITPTKKIDYQRGYCMVYAVAFQHQRGGQIVGIFDEVWDTVPRHVGVELNGKYYDSRGELSHDEFLNTFDIGKQTTIRPISETRLRGIYKSRNWDLSIELTENSRF
jgi:hypothetical protein